MTVMFKQRIDVSPEMVSFVGTGAIEPDAGIANAITLSFRLGNGDRPATIASGDTPEDDAAVVLAVATSACQRIFGFLPDAGLVGRDFELNAPPGHAPQLEDDVETAWFDELARHVDDLDRTAS